MTGLTFPGMMELPAWRGGREISPMPACGPDDMKRRSVEILSSEVAHVLSTYVDEALKGVTLTMESEVDLWETGETEYQLVLEGNVNNYAVIWTSSNNDVVTVDKNGKLTVGGAQGRAIITAKLGSRILKCTVIVERKWSNYY